MKPLETERLLLRTWTMNDWADLYAYAKHPDVGPNAGWPPHETPEMSKRIVQMFIDDGDVYAIVLKETNTIIGSIGIHERYPNPKLSKYKQREIGYVLNPDYWNCGYVTEAAKEVIRYAFEEMGMLYVWCGHFDFNVKSKRVIEKCGFQYEFSMEKELPLLKKTVNTLMYRITKEDYIIERTKQAGR